MQTSLRIAAPLVVAALAVSSVACSGGCSRSDKAQEGGTQGGSDNAPAAEVPTVPLPADFPKEIPVYPGSRVTAAAKSAGPAGKPAWSVTATSDTAMASIVAYYKEHLGDIRLKQEIGEANTNTTLWASAAYDLTIVATSVGGATSLAISVVGK